MQSFRGEYFVTDENTVEHKLLHAQLISIKALPSSEMALMDRKQVQLFINKIRCDCT